jgi:hypothetical protein
MALDMTIWSPGLDVVANGVLDPVHATQARGFEVALRCPGDTIWPRTVIRER